MAGATDAHQEASDTVRSKAETGIWRPAVDASAWRDRLGVPFFCYALSTALVVCSAAFGRAFLRQAPTSLSEGGPFLASFLAWDGGWYRSILVGGYEPKPSGPSNLAFFPAYPLLARGVSRVSGLSPDWALLVTSHGCLLGAMLLFYDYAVRGSARRRCQLRSSRWHAWCSCRTRCSSAWRTASR